MQNETGRQEIISVYQLTVTSFSDSVVSGNGSGELSIGLHLEQPLGVSFEYFIGL